MQDCLLLSAVGQMRLWMLFNTLKTAHMLMTGADMLAGLVAVECCWPDAALKEVGQVRTQVSVLNKAFEHRG